MIFRFFVSLIAGAAACALLFLSSDTQPPAPHSGAFVPLLQQEFSGQTTPNTSLHPQLLVPRTHSGPLLRAFDDVQLAKRALRDTLRSTPFLHPQVVEQLQARLWLAEARFFSVSIIRYCTGKNRWPECGEVKEHLAARVSQIDLYRAGLPPPDWEQLDMLDIQPAFSWDFISV